ncbi:HD-GYP domain-containing protein [Marinobacter confluentis]|uniref:HD-GYP domain-containing protein n=1 Tax=Marinobacter confluentis TaxID=1697557 RepID=A0A4Z1BP48_9GAMM|nr:HD-GYP domain-containing protein [Marinobacter confluentis]TGN39247.1 HD-GYP domain-containing protein [Marinobacter confluentis]
MSSSRQDIVETEIPVSQLAIGMHVVRLDRPWEETDFLLQGFIIQNEDDLLAVQTQCQTVYVEGRVDVMAARGASGNASGLRKTATPRKPGSLPEKRVTYINKVDTGREMARARAHYGQARETAKNIMSGIRLGRMLDMHQIRQTVDSTVDSVLRNENALLLLSKIKNKDDYTAEHCINVSILAAAFGKHLGLLEDEIRVLALSGMMHDVGKMKIDDAILNKPGALTPEEFDIMKKHTTYGRNLLAALPTLEHAAVDVAYSHHERMDGKGYPRGLPSQQIPLFAKMIGLVDTYDAITSSRVYDKGRASMQALQIIHRNKGTQFDADLAVEFIRMIGVYPPGSIIEFENGEVGIVVANRKSSKLKPVVLLVRDGDKNPITPYRQIDLSTGVIDTAGKAYKITHEVPDGTYGIVMSDFVEKGFLSTRPDGDSPPVDDRHGEP